MKSRKGGYKLVSLQLIELTTMTACAGLYGAIVNSHDKPLMLDDIKVNGEKKNALYVKAIKGTNKFTIKGIYGYILEVNKDDEVTITEDTEGIELPDVTAEDNGKVLEVIAGAWGIGEKKVDVMTTPSSTTITDEEWEQIKGGTFMNTEFLGLINPQFYAPAKTSGSTWQWLGVVIGSSVINRGGRFNVYEYNENNKTIRIYHNAISLEGGKIWIDEKPLPFYPADSAIGQYICRKGTLEYYIPVAQNNITSGDTIALDSDLGKALLDHLEVEINGFRARYEYTDGNYVVYSSKTETAGGLKLQVNMISYNTTNGELSFNQMTFTPDA